MKITTTATPEFTPVTITMVCETQEELNALGAIFNYSPTSDFISKEYLYAPFEKAGADISTEKLARHLKEVIKP